MTLFKIVLYFESDPPNARAWILGQGMPLGLTRENLGSIRPFFITLAELSHDQSGEISSLQADRSHR